MTESSGPPLGVRLVDLLRPSRLYDAIDARPTFVLPVLLLVAAAILYTQVAAGKAFPLIAQGMLTRSEVTETELARNFRLFTIFLASVIPWLLTFALATVAWGTLLLLRARRPLALVVSLFAWSGVWVAIGLLAKTGLVLVTGGPDPPVNLGLLLRPEDEISRVLVSLTNPFVILAAVWTVRGLRRWGVGSIAGWIAGAGPWLALAGLFAFSSGSTTRLTPAGPVDIADYGTIEIAPITLRFPPRLKRQEVEFIVKTSSGVTTQIAEQIGFTPRPLTVVAFPDHTTLERATGEFLHVQIVASIRGKDLLYVEMPGRSAAVPSETGLREVMRYVLVMQLAPVMGDAPRWFVHGVAHARVYPAGEALESRYLSILQRIGTPSYDSVLDPMLYRTPDGPLLARGLVDHLSFFYGREAVQEIGRDLAKGVPFRDSLFARTRLTTSALEAGWQDHVRTRLSIEDGSAPANAPDTAGAGDQPPTGSQPESSGGR